MTKFELTTNNYEVAELVTTTQERPRHHLVDDPVYLTSTELMFTYGFKTIMSILWTPLVLVFIIFLIFKKKLIKRR